eukprot:CAMPEP_0171461398 /NCGR_PEP_ID=MMETSP0945-20130129/5862_1 /TAXON_ID=109269 /ORGANISM="Vaucheria litorea, Strain CCMP2940" /LENGTH=85 /DNA_ID=CAMNT_0011987737 /DNA_START=117 /DNA_END=374 /DNA_ORIENTATION=-
MHYSSTHPSKVLLSTGIYVVVMVGIIVGDIVGAIVGARVIISSMVSELVTGNSDALEDIIEVEDEYVSTGSSIGTEDIEPEEVIA